MLELILFTISMHFAVTMIVPHTIRSEIRSMKSGAAHQQQTKEL